MQAQYMPCQQQQPCQKLAHAFESALPLLEHPFPWRGLFPGPGPSPLVPVLTCSCSACDAQGVEYTQSIATGWKPPARIRKLSEDDHQAVRDKFHIITEGDLLVPPVTTFQDLKLPPAMLRQLASKGIKKPTPIQMQVCVRGRSLHS